MLISRKVTEVSEISHVNLRAGWKELTKPINRSNSSLVQDVAPKMWTKCPISFPNVAILTASCLKHSIVSKTSIENRL